MTQSAWGRMLSRGHDVVLADTLQLPYRSASCDGAISIAVIAPEWLQHGAAYQEHTYNSYTLT